MSLIIDKINDLGLINDNDKIIVGVSGGADSMMLLHFLKFVRQVEVCVCHINHNLRGEESNRDMKFVSDICNEWNIPCVIYDEDITKYAKVNGLTIEQAGRDIRYERFEQLRKKLLYNKIATAHTMSDNVETILLNLMRGAGLNGLCGIPVTRENIIRPIIDLTREQIELYCEENNVGFIHDSTNFESDYTRNKIRLSVIPILKQINPRFTEKVGESVKYLSLDEDYINQQSHNTYVECLNDSAIDIQKLLNNHHAIVNRVILIFLKQNKLSVSSKLVETIKQSMINGCGKINVAQGVYVKISSGEMIIERVIPNCIEFKVQAKLGEITLQNGKTYRIYKKNASDIINNKKIYKNLFYICLDYDKIYGKLYLRSREQKDKITLHKRNCTKTVKKLFIENKLSSYDKSSRFILQAGEKVIAVEGIGVDESVAIDSFTKNVLVIETLTKQ